MCVLFKLVGEPPYKHTPTIRRPAHYELGMKVYKATASHVTTSRTVIKTKKLSAAMKVKMLLVKKPKWSSLNASYTSRDKAILKSVRVRMNVRIDVYFVTDSEMNLLLYERTELCTYSIHACFYFKISKCKHVVDTSYTKFTDRASYLYLVNSIAGSFLCMFGQCTDHHRWILTRKEEGDNKNNWNNTY